MTAEAGNGYWIDTTSNACTITLPSSADNGDLIIFADYDRTWGTYGIVLEAADVLSGQTASSANVDVVISYLDQTL